MQHNTPFQKKVMVNSSPGKVVLGEPLSSKCCSAPSALGAAQPEHENTAGGALDCIFLPHSQGPGQLPKSGPFPTENTKGNRRN